MAARRSWFRESPTGGGSLGRAIKIRRIELGLERRDLAERARVSYPYLAEIENGAKPGSQRVLHAIADALGLELHELLEQAARLDARMEEAEERVAAKRSGVAGRTTTSAREAAPAPAPSPRVREAPLSATRDAEEDYELLERRGAEPLPAETPLFLRKAYAPADEGAVALRARDFGYRRVEPGGEHRSRLLRDAVIRLTRAKMAPEEAELFVALLSELIDERVRFVVRDELRRAGVEVRD